MKKFYSRNFFVTCSKMGDGRPKRKRLLKMDMSLVIFKFWLRYLLGWIVWGVRSILFSCSKEFHPISIAYIYNRVQFTQFISMRNLKGFRIWAFSFFKSLLSLMKQLKFPDTFFHSDDWKSLLLYVPLCSFYHSCRPSMESAAAFFQYGVPIKADTVRQENCWLIPQPF